MILARCDVKRTWLRSCPNTLGPMVSANQDADAQLVDRYLAGDATAFDEMMIRHQRRIYRICYRFVENTDDAMDLAQDVFIKAFEHLENFRREFISSPVTIAKCLAGRSPSPSKTARPRSKSRTSQGRWITRSKARRWQSWTQGRRRCFHDQR